MAKAKQQFFCKECGLESVKWLGQCPGCKAWNSFVEAPKELPGFAHMTTGNALQQTPKYLSEITAEEQQRVLTGISEFDRVLGGGIVPGSLVLVGGDPGIGKSTLLLQMCREVSAKKNTVLYISGEESLHQIKMRADRLHMEQSRMQLLCECDMSIITDVLTNMHPGIVVVDSIQTVVCESSQSTPGSVGQIREATQILMRLAKSLCITIFIVGHVTKEGTVAGPKMLEHMVDTVLYFEGETVSSYRILRAVKNRFGSTNEIGVFQMREDGLEEVSNPSAYLLEGKPEQEAGSVVTATMEGTRPVLVEIQALVSRTNFNMPRRTSVGTDYNRINLLMAVMEKKLGINLSACDAYINLAGGMKISEPALDLAVIAAILSSYRNRAPQDNTVIFGEVGLTGEVRNVSMAEQRISEAAKLGYSTCIIPRGVKKTIASGKPGAMKLIEVSNIKELCDLI